MDAKVLELVNQLLAVVKADDAAAAPATPVVETPAAETPAAPAAPADAPAAAAPAETPPAVETPAPEAESAESKESAAKLPPHDHNHAHVSTYGYQYSHSHAHGDAAHAEADDHDMSETAHAHEHVAKALDPETEADLKGLKADLDAAKLEITQLTEKLSAVEAAKSAAVTAAARKPLVAPTAGGTPVEKSAPQISSDMKYDDAFDKLMGRK